MKRFIILTLFSIVLEGSQFVAGLGPVVDFDSCGGKIFVLNWNFRAFCFVECFAGKLIVIVPNRSRTKSTKSHSKSVDEKMNK